MRVSARILILALCVLLVHLSGVSSIIDVPAVTMSGMSINASIAVPSFSPEEEEHVTSVTVRLYCSTPGALIFYTLDNTSPDLTSSPSAASGEPILIDTVGVTIVRAFSYLSNTTKSDGGGVSSSEVSKKYTILARCLPPLIVPGGGTFAGAVTVSMSSATPGAHMLYTLDNTTPREGGAETSSSVLLRDTDTLVLTSSTTLSVIAVKPHFAPSAVTKQTFTILPKVATPLIEPHQTTFAVSATLTITCATANATIYYTTDGSPPSESSYRLDPLRPQIVLDEAGQYSVTAFATGKNMLQSDLITKFLTILPRAASPVLHPKPGTFVNEVSVCFSCPSASTPPAESTSSGAATGTSSGTVYYTLDGRSTPSEQSPHLPCGSCLLLTAPAVVHLRAFVSEDQKSPSSIFTAQYTLVRPPYDTYPVNPNATLQLRPDVNIYVVETNLPYPSYPKSGYCGKRNIRGRLVVLHNPIGHFDVMAPEHGCGGGLSLPSVSGRQIWEKDTLATASKFAAASTTAHASATDSVGPAEATATATDEASSTASNDESNTEGITAEGAITDSLKVTTVTATATRSIGASNAGASSSTTASAASSNSNPLAHELPSYASYYSPSQLASLSQDDISVWEEEYSQVNSQGCEVVTNAGFFNVSSGACFGDLVTAGKVVQTSPKHNVNFGIRAGQFVTGYVTSEEITGDVSGGSENSTSHVPFDTLISGLGWLVRGGEAYVDESFHSMRPPAHPSKDDADGVLSSLYGEDMSAQTSGDSFPTLLSARTALGHDAEGRLLLLQVEGESWVRGMSLAEFAAFAVDLGFVSAINLDGGGSATMTVNHTLVSEPSWQCIPEDFLESSSLLPRGAQERAFCEKRVSSVTCIHSMPAPLSGASKAYKKEKGEVFPVSPPTARPAAITPSGGNKNIFDSDTPDSAANGSTDIIFNPSASPTSASESGTPTHHSSSSCSAKVKQLEAQLRIVHSSESMFKYLSSSLGFLLVVSLLAHMFLCCRDTDRDNASPSNTEPQNASFQWHSQNSSVRIAETECNSNNNTQHNDRSRNSSRDVEMYSSARPDDAYPHVAGRRETGGDIEQGIAPSSFGRTSHIAQQRPLPRSQTLHGQQRHTPRPISQRETEEEKHQKQKYAVNDRGRGRDDDNEDELALEHYGLSDTLDFNEFDDSDDDEMVTLKYKNPSEMAYINQPVAPVHKEAESVRVQCEEEGLEEDEMDIADEEQASLLSSAPSTRPSPPPAAISETENSRKKKKPKEKKSKRMSMDFSDRSL